MIQAGDNSGELFSLLYFFKVVSTKMRSLYRREIAKRDGKSGRYINKFQRMNFVNVPLRRLKFNQLFDVYYIDSLKFYKH